MIRITRALRSCFLQSSIALLALLCMTLSSASAQSSSSIAQRFQTKSTDITAASLVGIQGDNSSSVELSSKQRVQKLVGVVSDQPLIELSDGQSGVQVVTSGLTMTLVSDINGSIVPGDKITASPIEGVGMKATESTTSVGTAQSILDLTKSEVRKISDVNGKQLDVHIGLVPVQVSVAFYSPAANGNASFMPSFLQDIANTVAGRSVSPARVLVAALILLLLFVSITVLLYSSVRSSIISIGRNPLSEQAVHKSLVQVGVTVTAVLLCTIGLIYLVLTV